jgi:hypothetical protein
LSGQFRRYGNRRYQRAGLWDQFRVDIRVDGHPAVSFRHVRMIGSGRYD